MRADLRRLKTDQAYLKKRQARAQRACAYAAHAQATRALTRMRMRAQIRHAETLRSSDSRAVAWSAAECAALLALAGVQMTLFRRAFRNY
jgi:hypothetical protein